MLAIILVAASCREPGRQELTVMTFNIRYDNPADGANSWPERREMVVNFLDSIKPDIFGLQEALWNQYLYIDSALEGYGSLAAGRDDGKMRGEAVPLFYRTDRFRIVDSGTFWLSQTPDIPGSKGWGAVLPRITSWVCLEEREGGQQIYHFNTHFSHMSDSARIMSSRILKKAVAMISSGKPSIITGDFNMTPSSLASMILKEGDEIIDTYDISTSSPEGMENTFNGFSDNATGDRIDYIFVKGTMGARDHVTWKIVKDSIYISDHWPVSVKITY